MVEFDFKPFQKNLRTLIEARGALIKDVAVENDMTATTLSRYLSGDRTPELKYAMKLADYFDVSFDWLLGVNGDKFDLLPQETQEFAELYTRATPDDRRVVKAVLDKYKEENWSNNHRNLKV